MLGGRRGGILLNNKLSNGNIANGTTNWSKPNGGILSATVNELSFTASANAQYAQNVLQGGTVIGQIYYGCAYVKTTSSNVGLRVGGVMTPIYHSGGGNYERLSAIYTATTTGHSVNIIDNRTNEWDAIKIKNAMAFDVTDLVNAGKTKADIDNMLLNCSDYFTQFIL